jgi:hypothetical protein
MPGECTEVKRSVVLRAMLAVLLAGMAGAQAEPPVPAQLQVAAIDHGALVVRQGTAPFITLAKGGRPRALPVFSPDGGKIAFVQSTSPDVALADLVVVGRDGRDVVRVPIEPVREDTEYAGMRYVEQLRWLSPTKVMVRGSINPSQSQYYVADIESGKMVADFTDDESAAAFSPDGAHVATLSGSPHFTPEDKRAPSLAIDNRTVFPEKPRPGLEFLTAPRWSPDSQALAWLVRDRAAERTALGIWHEGEVREAPVELAADAQADLFWSGRKVILTASQPGVAAHLRAWSADETGQGLTSIDARSVSNPRAAALDLRSSLLAGLRQSGIVQPDVWCSACSLALLPRSSE